jgi:hypothetical protein
VGSAGYGTNALLPGLTPLEVSFSELTPEALRLDFQPDLGGGRSPARLVAALRGTIAEHFEEDLAREFASRTRSLWAHPGEAGFGAFVGAACDGSGLREAKVYCPLEWVRAGDELRPLAAAAKAELSGLSDLMRAVGVERGGVVERAYLVCRNEIELLSLEPLLQRFGLAHRLPELVVTLLRLTGGSFVLMPGSTVIGLRRRRGGVEVKIELLPHAVPAPDRLDAVTGLLAERPASQAAFRRWWRALAAPETHAELGAISVRVTRDHGVRLNVYAHPVVGRAGERAEHAAQLHPVLG